MIPEKLEMGFLYHKEYDRHSLGNKWPDIEACVKMFENFFKTDKIFIIKPDFNEVFTSAIYGGKTEYLAKLIQEAGDYIGEILYINK